MITIHTITATKNTINLDTAVEQAASDRNCELDSSMTYGEQANFLRQEAEKSGNSANSMADLVNILDAAETHFHILESGA